MTWKKSSIPLKKQKPLSLRRRKGRRRMGFGEAIVIVLFLALSAVQGTTHSDLTISKLDRRVDLTSQSVRITSTLKVENQGTEPASEVLLAFPERQARNLAFLSAKGFKTKTKTKSSVILSVNQVKHPEDAPPALAFFGVSLPNSLLKGDSFTVEVLAVFTHALRPFPHTITQAEVQLLVFEESGYLVSPYIVNHQSLSLKLPHSSRIEAYTKLHNTTVHGSEINYGPYHNLPPFSFTPLVVHFESKQAFAVAQQLVREIEISHWGNVQLTDHYNLNHGGAHIKGEFSRLDYQARPHIRAASAFTHLVAKLPPRARYVYYRDDIGNISTSHLWGDSKKMELEIEPRYPMFGGWKTSFTIGYSLPLHDFLFHSDGKRFLNLTFGSPINDLVIDTLIVKVVLPEGSSDISASTPFPVKQLQETKISHLDIAGRPVVVLEKNNVVADHNQYFQVYYKFNSLAMLTEPLMLISGFFFFFIACIMYTHADLSISKSSASYLAKLQWDEVQAAVQEVESIMTRCLAIHEKLEASLRDLSRTGDVQACKAARKAADASLKELTKELKPLLAFLQSSHQASHIYPKVEELVAKERELQEKMMGKHATVVDCYEKKYGGKEIENRVAQHQHKINALKQEVDDLLEFIDEI